MKFNKQAAEVFIPDGTDEKIALGRTTDLCIAAHQDDIEIMSFAPAAKCYGKADEWFTGVVMTDGAGSPRSGIYEEYTDEEMKVVRVTEQKNAASVGGYSAQFLLSYNSSEIKDAGNTQTVEEIAAIIKACNPEIVYTHNLADKHDTHVAVALRVIAAIRSLPADLRPKKVYSLEVWRGLDWLCDEDKSCFDTSTHPNLAAALLGVFDSQIAGGKRYDSAAIGRRLANATFFASHDTDNCESMSYGLDITELINSNTDGFEFVNRYINNFKDEVEQRIRRFS
ncbi:MAG: PIG-L family deacetylase [Oscillospiraceae bacterium]|nr:PIG-L family deacetylase [Oscillospiraceae bacterium]